MKSFSGYGTNFSNIDLQFNTELEYLSLDNNKNLLALNIENNKKLKNLNIANTNINELDTEYNINLENLNVNNCQLKDLQLLNNKKLKYLYIQNNKLIELDLSQTPLLKGIDFSKNKNLNFVNLKNGSNKNIFYFVATNNPALNHICVDDINYAYQKFTRKDIHTNFTNSCNSNPNNNFTTSNLEGNIKIHPVPFINELTIKGIDTKNDFELYFYSANGKQFSVNKIITDDSKLSIETNEIPKGVYFIKIITSRETIIKKIIKQ